MRRLARPLLLLVLASCAAETPQEPPAAAAAKPAMNAKSHEEEILEWRRKRVERLTSEDGWLTLVGLAWLEEGTNTIALPSKPPVKVTITLEGGTVTLAPEKGVAIDGRPVAQPTLLRDDTDPSGPTIVSAGTLRFHVIRRASRYGIRMKDPEAPARKNFRGLDYFPIDPKWRVEARFTPFPEPKRVTITNVLGFTTEEISPGTLTFSVDGRSYTLQPILEQGETDYFVIFKDATSGKETYAAARYVYVPPAGADGMTVIDFNKAYNPPCVFTKFATCPLPPPQNRLPIRVEAGEKDYGH
ncbi:MAG TPA: DUF1684 domain-containing protein [Thermoanaerobaculia bacterium]|nr:DUF1684 domain-containing protein [Thermoanaerobaculia bacterium]